MRLSAQGLPRERPCTRERIMRRQARRLAHIYAAQRGPLLGALLSHAGARAQLRGRGIVGPPPGALYASARAQSRFFAQQQYMQGLTQARERRAYPPSPPLIGGGGVRRCSTLRAKSYIKFLSRVHTSERIARARAPAKLARIMRKKLPARYAIEREIGICSCCRI